MTSYPTIRTVQVVKEEVHSTAKIGKQPKFAVGDQVQIYSGTYEDYVFRVDKIRFNYDDRWKEAEYEYLYEGMLHGDWIGERNLSKVYGKTKAR